MIDLSLNEAETLAAKAARGGGFSWGYAEEIGRGARGLAAQDDSWSKALLALLEAAASFQAPDRERIARWRRGEGDVTNAQPLCPVRTAALLLDEGRELCREPLRLINVGLPIWLLALLGRSNIWVADVEDKNATRGDVIIRRADEPERPANGRRAAIEPQIFAALNLYAVKTYVPESERSRARGAGGGRVDDDA